MAPPPGFSPGMPPPRPSSSAGHNGGGYHRDRSAGFEAKMISPHDSRYVKSSPLSENAESPSDRHAHSKSADAAPPASQQNKTTLLRMNYFRY